MSCDVGEGMERLENEPSSFPKLCLFTYVTAHSPTLPSLYLSHSSFFNPSVASPTSQFILQPFFRFSYVTGFLLTSPGEPLILQTFRHFTYVTAHSPILPSLYGRFLERKICNPLVNVADRLKKLRGSGQLCLVNVKTVLM